MNFGNLLHWAVVFLVVAIIAALLGFGGVAGTAMEGARMLFWVALVLHLARLRTYPQRLGASARIERELPSVAPSGNKRPPLIPSGRRFFFQGGAGGITRKNTRA
jgi:uncharacterized membrane protein YtjA (UPF0391 family)